MAKITVYKVRSDGVFDGDVELEVRDPIKSGIPAGYTRSSPHPIPDDHYAIFYGAWTYVAGEKPDEPPIAPSVPKEVSMRQARLALFEQGLLAQVDAALSSIPDETERTKAQIEWEYATVVERDAALTQSLGAAMGMTEEQLDQLFIFAATL